MDLQRKISGKLDGFVIIRCRDQNTGHSSFQWIFKIQTKRRKWLYPYLVRCAKIQYNGYLACTYPHERIQSWKLGARRIVARFVQVGTKVCQINKLEIISFKSPIHVSQLISSKIQLQFTNVSAPLKGSVPLYYVDALNDRYQHVGDIGGVVTNVKNNTPVSIDGQ